MFCKNCGAQVEDGTKFCPCCGRSTEAEPAPVNNVNYNAPVSDDARSGGFAFLCFVWPIVGLILYLVWKDQKPLRAKSCGKGAIIGVIVQFVGGILLGIMYSVIITAAVSTYYSLLPMII